jgi:hypothetical protein
LHRIRILPAATALPLLEGDTMKLLSWKGLPRVGFLVVFLSAAGCASRPTAPPTTAPSGEKPAPGSTGAVSPAEDIAAAAPAVALDAPAWKEECKKDPKAAKAKYAREGDPAQRHRPECRRRPVPADRHRPPGGGKNDVYGVRC